MKNLFLETFQGPSKRPINALHLLGDMVIKWRQLHDPVVPGLQGVPKKFPIQKSLFFVNRYTYGNLKQLLKRTADCDHVFVCATMSYCELISETMCYYVLLCVTI